MSGTNHGYMRVSTGRQDMVRDAQRRALETAGCGEIAERNTRQRRCTVSESQAAMRSC